MTTLVEEQTIESGRHLHARKQRRPVAISTMLTCAGTVTWLISALSSQNSEPRTWGMLAVVPATWYLGVLLVVLGFLTSSRIRRYEGVIAVGSLFLALRATPAIVYALPRVPWAAKHVGVTQYILANGSVHWNLDTYQSWPALFAAVGWMTSSLRFHDVMLVAKWWPVFIGALRLVVFYPLTSRFIADHKRRCLACVFLVLADSIGQDYFSPQSVGVVLALGIFLFSIPVDGETTKAKWIRLSAALVCGIAVIPTHELTPYLVIAGLVALAAFRIVRPWWIPVPIAALSAAWTLLHWSTLHQYLGPSGVGALAGNTATRTVAGGLYAPENLSLRLPGWALGLGVLVLGGLALITVVAQRNRMVFGLAACAAANASVLLITSYGNEGSFRVVLFALPWLAILAASVDVSRLPTLGLLLACVPLLLGIHLIADYPLDAVYLMQPSDLAAISYFGSAAPKNSILLTGGAMPDSPTARYLTGRRNMPVADPRDASAAQAAQQLLPYLDALYGGRQLYVLFSSQTARYYELYGLQPVSYYDQFEQDVADNPRFELVFESGSTRLYEVRSAAAIGTGAENA